MQSILKFNYPLFIKIVMKEYTIIIFGGTGDLTQRKLIPAIFSLAKRDSSIKINVVGVGRRDYNTQSYISFISPNHSSPNNVSISYFKSNLDSEDSLSGLKEELSRIESSNLLGRIYYLSTNHDLFTKIVKSLHSQDLDSTNIFSRVIAEKPFGEDLKSSRKLNKELREFFSESQIFRADHYLAKDTIDNILKIRFSNPLFESVWNSKSISKIKIVVDEELGVENRLGYYDKSGAIKDMIQNHILQTLSFILMDAPDSLSESDFRKSKIEALRNLNFTGDLKIAQYEGYQNEVKELNPGSKTETFAEVKLSSSSKRWAGTEILLRTGKKLSKREAYIEIEFKKEPCYLFCNLNSAPNKLIIHIQPLKNIELSINTTLPSESMKLSPVKMIFSPEKEFNSESPESYEVIIRECLSNNRSLFISDEELEVAWKLTDDILSTKSSKELLIYKSGSINVK